MKCISLFLLLFVGGCATIQVPSAYTYREIKTPGFTLAAWVKDTDTKASFHVYLEGDGRAYTNSGFPSHDPTPKSGLMRQKAFKDSAPNVAYLARPCQFVKDSMCTQKDWTTSRFSPQIVASVATALMQIVGDRPVELYAYSGGALLSGLVIANYPEIKVTQWTTYAGLLNHSSWTAYKHLAPLRGSLDLQQLPNVPQTHYVGGKDKVVPLKLSVLWTGNKNLVIVPDSTHHGPFVSTTP